MQNSYLSIMEIFNQLAPMLKVFWIIAAISSLIFIIQSIMTFTGTDAGDGVSADFDGDLADGDSPFQLFSFRNLINFLLGFSWAGISFYSTIENKTVLVIIAFLIGASFLVAFFFIIQQLQKLAEDNTFSIKNTLHKTGEVYLTIPAEKKGKGKVLISVNGAVHELNAVTNGNTLASGEIIRVINILDDNLLLVEKL
ncbi:MAG: serine protease [Chitinophagaceae bacterium]|jgi:hypothetical protein|nr:serine protease [Chitinophagaceae bacterium]